MPVSHGFPVEKRKRQFLFTASSLKALEVMNNHNVYVTTANPNNRFIQLEYVTRSNNLRDSTSRPCATKADKRRGFPEKFSPKG